MYIIGIALALGAMLAWGFGDFYIQKTSRKAGVVNSLFYITAAAAVLLFPFIFNDLSSLSWSQIWLLTFAGIVAFVAGLFIFKALREGKISVIEPLAAFELPLTVGLTVAFHGEKLNWLQWIFIFIIFLGIMLTVTMHKFQLHYHKRLLEKGVLLAGFGAISMALTNFLIGVGSQQTSPLLAIWFTHTVIAILCLIYLLYKNKEQTLVSDLKNYPHIIFAEAIYDNVAWIFFAFAVTFLPISQVVTISESYVALAAILGVAINREKLKKHQILGIVLAIIGVIIFSTISRL